MDPFRFSDRLPQCSRCRGDLIMSAVAPQDDEHGRPIHLELCPACDTGDVGRPAVAFSFNGSPTAAAMTKIVSGRAPTW
jgi:hypothetical protein